MLHDISKRFLYDLIYVSKIQKLIPDNDHYIGAILSLHRVLPNIEEPHLGNIGRICITQGYLEQLIRYFRTNNISILSLDEVHDIILNSKKDRRFVSITFDDGYIDNYEVVFPMFKRLGIPFTIYLSTSIPDGNFINWYFMLDDLILKNNRIEFTAFGKKYSHNTETLSRKERTYRILENMINKISLLNRGELLRSIFTPYGYDLVEYSNKLSLAWNHVKEMSASGIVTIGGHTVNHLDLTLLDKGTVEEEIRKGMEIIRYRIGKNVEHFAYPFGCVPAVTERELEIARTFQFKTCCTTMHGYISGNQKHFLDRLPRVNITENTKISSVDISFNSKIDKLLRIKPFNKYKKL